MFGQSRVLLLSPPDQLALILVAPGGTALLFLIVASLYLVFWHFFILQVCQAFRLVTFSKDSSFWSQHREMPCSLSRLAGFDHMGLPDQCCSPGKELLNSWVLETSTKALDRCISELSICILGIYSLTHPDFAGHLHWADGTNSTHTTIPAWNRLTRKALTTPHLPG